MKIRICLMLLLGVATTLNAYAQTVRDLGRTAVTLAVPYRVALVVGNKDYSVGPLTNPVNDAQDMAATLNKLGFDKIILRTNRTAKELESDIHEFGDELRTNGVGFFYYSGHGMQIEGRNYLLPINVNPKREADVKYDAVDAGRVLDELERKGTAVNLVVLDACRNNPFSRSFRSTSRGLARMDAPSGTLIVYATRPGQVAEDGTGRNGTFTKHLLAKLNEQPDLEVRLLLSDVRAAVLQETGKTQEPWEEGGLVGQFRFASAAPVRIEPLPRQALSYLTLTTKPSDARVKILNIAAGYQEGMALSPGDYHVEVAAEGYQAYRQWMVLNPGPQRYDIDLVPLRLESTAEAGRNNDEGQQEGERIDQAFAQGKYEVTRFAGPNLIGRSEQAKRVAAMANIREIESALHLYRLDNFKYPTTDEGLEALVNKPSNAKAWKDGGYLSKLPKDPWGRDYQYVSPGTHGSFDIYTLGADGQQGGEGSNADIGNWGEDPRPGSG